MPPVAPSAPHAAPAAAASLQTPPAGGRRGSIAPADLTPAALAEAATASTLAALSRLDQLPQALSVAIAAGWAGVRSAPSPADGASGSVGDALARAAAPLRPLRVGGEEAAAVDDAVSGPKKSHSVAAVDALFSLASDAGGVLAPALLAMAQAQHLGEDTAVGAVDALAVACSQRAALVTQVLSAVAEVARAEAVHAVGAVAALSRPPRAGTPEHESAVATALSQLRKAQVSRGREGDDGLTFSYPHRPSLPSRPLPQVKLSAAAAFDEPGVAGSSFGATMLRRASAAAVPQRPTTTGSLTPPLDPLSAALVSQHCLVDLALRTIAGGRPLAPETSAYDYRIDVAAVCAQAASAPSSAASSALALVALLLQLPPVAVAVTKSALPAPSPRAAAKGAAAALDAVTATASYAAAAARLLQSSPLADVARSLAKALQDATQNDPAGLLGRLRGGGPGGGAASLAAASLRWPACAVGSSPLIAGLSPSAPPPQHPPSSSPQRVAAAPLIDGSPLLTLLCHWGVCVAVASACRSSLGGAAVALGSAAATGAAAAAADCVVRVVDTPLLSVLVDSVQHERTIAKAAAADVVAVRGAPPAPTPLSPQGAAATVSPGRSRQPGDGIAVLAGSTSPGSPLAASSAALLLQGADWHEGVSGASAATARLDTAAMTGRADAVLGWGVEAAHNADALGDLLVRGGAAAAAAAPLSIAVRGSGQAAAATLAALFPQRRIHAVDSLDVPVSVLTVAADSAAAAGAMHAGGRQGQQSARASIAVYRAGGYIALVALHRASNVAPGGVGSRAGSSLQYALIRDDPAVLADCLAASAYDFDPAVPPVAAGSAEGAARTAALLGHLVRLLRYECRPPPQIRGLVVRPPGAAASAATGGSPRTAAAALDLAIERFSSLGLRGAAQLLFTTLRSVACTWLDPLRDESQPQVLALVSCYAEPGVGIGGTVARAHARALTYLAVAYVPTEVPEDAVSDLPPELAAQASAPPPGRGEGRDTTCDPSPPHPPAACRPSPCPGPRTRAAATPSSCPCPSRSASQ